MVVVVVVVVVSGVAVDDNGGTNGVVGNGNGTGCSTSGRTGANSGSGSARNVAARDDPGRCMSVGENAGLQPEEREMVLIPTSDKKAIAAVLLLVARIALNEPDKVRRCESSSKDEDCLLLVLVVVVADMVWIEIFLYR